MDIKVALTAPSPFQQTSDGSATIICHPKSGQNQCVRTHVYIQPIAPKPSMMYKGASVIRVL